MGFVPVGSVPTLVNLGYPQTSPHQMIPFSLMHHQGEQMQRMIPGQHQQRYPYPSNPHANQNNHNHNHSHNNHQFHTAM